MSVNSWQNQLRESQIFNARGQSTAESNEFVQDTHIAAASCSILQHTTSLR
jgi:hypothetical protein